MFAEEDKHGLVEDMHIAKAVFLCAFALVMKDGRGHIAILKAGFQKTIGEIDVFSVHKKRFVEAPTMI